MFGTPCCGTPSIKCAVIISSDTCEIQGTSDSRPRPVSMLTLVHTNHRLRPPHPTLTHAAKRRCPPAISNTLIGVQQGNYATRSCTHPESHATTPSKCTKRKEVRKRMPLAPMGIAPQRQNEEKMPCKKCPCNTPLQRMPLQHSGWNGKVHMLTDVQTALPAPTLPAALYAVPPGCTRHRQQTTCAH